MRTETIKIYSFNELSENAQRYAWENGGYYGDAYALDFETILEKFENAFDIKVYRYSVGNGYKPTFSYTLGGAAADAPEGDPLRLARYMWNNYAEEITRGKYYSTRMKWIGGNVHYKSRRSKVLLSLDEYALTGICWDQDILQPIIDCLKYKRFFNDIEELFDACLTAFFAAWDADIEYCNSLEYFADVAEANEYEFTANGERWA